MIHRGFGGDWVVTPRDIAGDTKPDVLPGAAPPPTGTRRRAATSCRRPSDRRAGSAGAQLLTSFTDLMTTASVGHVLVHPLRRGLHLLDLLHDVHPLDDLAEDRVADAVLRLVLVQEVVVLRR